MDWGKAEERLNALEELYREIGYLYPGILRIVQSLRGRFEARERSEDLYAAIMEVD